MVDLATPADHRVKLKKKSEKKKDEGLKLAREPMKHESVGDTNCYRRARYSHQRIDIGAGRLGNKRRNRNHPHYNIIKITQDTEKSPGDLRRLAVTQTPLKTIS